MDNRNRFKDLSNFDNRLKKIETKKIKPIYVYTKAVNEDFISSNIIRKEFDKKNLNTIIDSLLKNGDLKKIKELNLNDNCIDWINSIFRNEEEKYNDYMKFLIRDFTKSMKTRMREQEKYIIGIINIDKIILCHSIYGEKTITPRWKIIERMLDKDNVLRFVCFKKGKDLQVIFYENQRSLFLINWLGLSEKEAFKYLHGKNKFFTEINGIPLALEISDDVFEKKIYNNSEIMIRGDNIALPTPLSSLYISKIKRNKKTCKDMNEFIQKFLAVHYNLSYYQEKYNELKNSLTCSIYKLIDGENKLYDIEDNEYVNKTNENFNIIFCNDKIIIENTFLESLKNKIINNVPIKIFHPGCELINESLKIKNFEIFNKVNAFISKPIIEYYKNSHDDELNKILICCIFNILAQENNHIAISYLFEVLYKKILSELKLSINTKFYENNLIELKSKDFIDGDNSKIISNIQKDIEKKLRVLEVCIYILGYDEKEKSYEPILESRFDDSRINNLEETLKTRLNLKTLKFLRIPLGSKRCFLILIVSK